VGPPFPPNPCGHFQVYSGSRWRRRALVQPHEVRASVGSVGHDLAAEHCRIGRPLAHHRVIGEPRKTS
jgi:hypothetical protein